MAIFESPSKMKWWMPANLTTRLEAKISKITTKDGNVIFSDKAIKTSS